MKAYRALDEDMAELAIFLTSNGTYTWVVCHILILVGTKWILPVFLTY